ncbi:hypothetical protein Pcinc_007708 [Petrolisthes cinctipes]|uniref:Uncharacterized protein n=1 Tax=Petrolisthes cinctipes TaxID=88211 RepID=A0AAE1GAJ8_PETCI|nr:hypothetical protein Pcinc_007708 [Petrolisthes cinctipes]
MHPTVIPCPPPALAYTTSFEIAINLPVPFSAFRSRRGGGGGEVQRETCLSTMPHPEASQQYRPRNWICNDNGHTNTPHHMHASGLFSLYDGRRL